MGLFDIFKKGLQKTRNFVSEGITKISASMGRFDEDMIDDLEALLVQADCGVGASLEIMDEVRDSIKKTGDDSKDAVVRVVPGVIGDEQSALSDCFQDDLLAAPIYTRPADYKGWKVPDILLSGNEAKIRNWELEQAMERTRQLRPDLLKE